MNKGEASRPLDFMPAEELNGDLFLCYTCRTQCCPLRRLFTEDLLTITDCVMGSLSAEQSLWLQYHHHHHHHRSPVESPPIAKKFFRLSCSQEPQRHYSLCESVSDSDTVYKENRSILKQVDGDRAKTCNDARDTLRRVNFRQNVAVLVYDRADGKCVSCESQQLNTEPKDRRRFVSRTLPSKVQSSFVRRSSLLIDEHSAASPLSNTAADTSGRRTSVGRPLPPVLAPADDRPAPPLTSIEFTFHEDRRGQLWLRFAVPLGVGISAGNALVKTNVAGNKVRVLGTRHAAQQQFTTRFSLPVDVDPYAISARMDSTGTLFVEAPVKSCSEQRRPTAAADAASSLV